MARLSQITWLVASIPAFIKIVSLSTLLPYGLLRLHFAVSLLQIALTTGTALLTQ